MAIKISRMNLKDQIRIPKEIREYLNIRPGEHIYFETSKEGIIIKKAHMKKLSDVLTSAKPFDENVIRSIEDIRNEWI